MRVLAFLFMFCLFITAPLPALALENIAGIWEGAYDSSKHLTWNQKRTNLSAEFSHKENDISFLKEFFTSTPHSADTVSHRFKTKIYYKGNKLYLNDLTGSPVNMLHFVGLPDLFANLWRSNKLPVLKNLVLPLIGGPQSIEIKKNQTGTINIPTAMKYDIKLTSNFNYQNNDYQTATLVLHIEGFLTLETLNKKPKNIREDITFKIDMPLQRNTNHSSWNNDEIEALLISLTDHPYYSVAWGKKDNEAHRRLPEVIWGSKEGGYKALMKYAFNKYGVKTPINAIFYPNLEVPAQYDRIANAAPGKYFVKIGPKAFKHPLIYTVSSYVHEYTHYKQWWLTWWKLQRETEAYCVQMKWLKENYSKEPKLNYLPLQNLLDEAEGGFKAEPKLAGKTLVCDNSLGLKRWNTIRTELIQGHESTSPEQRNIQDNSFAPQKSESGEKWKTIIDY